MTRKQIISIEAPSASGTDAYGNPTPAGWTVLGLRWAYLSYVRGSEVIQTGGLTGKATYKAKIHNDSLSRQITTACRIVVGSDACNIREIDTMTDRVWVYLTFEKGVAV